MIFKPELVKKIRKGRKTMTRRPVKQGRLGETKRCRYRPGSSYAVQPGRGEKETCRITVDHVRRERLGDITHDDAKAEGFLTTKEFLDYWEDLYGSLDLEQPVWVITFRLGEAEKPMFLSGQTQQSDYTFVAAQSADAKQEVIDQEAIDRFTVQSRVKATQERREQRLRAQARTLQKRLREATVRAEREDVDITDNLARIQAELEDIERKRTAA